MSLTLHHPDGQVFTFDAGALCLELASATGGEGFRARFEQLPEPEDFPRWAAQSRLDVRGHGIDPAEIVMTRADLRRLKTLREAIWAAAFAAATGARPSTIDIETINSFAAGRGVVPQVRPDNGGATWRRPVTAAQLTTEIARDAVHTLSQPTRDRVRMCAGVNCYLIYLDISRPGQRRWCSMQRCGNRHKARAFRDRRGGPE